MALLQLIASNRVALPPGLSPGDFLDRFGTGMEPGWINRAPGTIPFGDSGYDVGWGKAPIGCMFDMLGLTPAQRKRLWSEIGHPNKTFHRTAKDDRWYEFPTAEGPWIPSGSGKTVNELFDLMCVAGVLRSDSLFDAVKLAHAIAVSFNVTYMTYVDGDPSASTAYGGMLFGRCDACSQDRLHDKNDTLISHVLFGHASVARA